MSRRIEYTCDQCGSKGNPDEIFWMKKKFWCGDCANQTPPEYLAREREFWVDRHGSFDFSSCPATVRNNGGGCISPLEATAGMRRAGVPVRHGIRDRMRTEVQIGRRQRLEEIHPYPERRR